MAEVFNSGAGGYTCDLCSTLLWSGKDAKDKRIDRVYIYQHSAKDIFETKTGKYKFCKSCGPKKPETRSRER